MPFLGPFFAGLQGILAAGGLGAFALRLGGSLLLSSLSKALTPKPKGVTNRTVTVREPASPRQLVYGRVRKGGTIIFLHAGADLPIIDFPPSPSDLAAAQAFAASGTIPGTAIRLSAPVVLPGNITAVVGVGGIYPTARLLSWPGLTPVSTPTGYGTLTANAALEGGLLRYRLAPASTAGTAADRRQLHIVIALAGHRVKSLGAIYFDGQVAVDSAGVVQPRWANLVRVEKALGGPNQSAFPLLRADLPTMWTANHRLRGVAAVALRLTFSNTAFPNGIPNITVDVEGKDDILDPRTGLRGWTDNAALCVADYMAMPSDIGLGAAIGSGDGIDDLDLIEAANICDETVPLQTGGSERRYTCNGIVSLDEDPKAIIQAMLTAMAGRAAYQGGVWRIRAGAYRIPTTTLTVKDARGALKLQTRISRAENFNGVRGTFISPENDWQPDDFPAVASSVYLAEDRGERKWRDIALPFTISATMAQRLAKIELERARRQMTVQFPGKLAAWRATVAEGVNLTYSRWGFAAKPFDVLGMTSEIAREGNAPQLLPDLVLRETSPLVYSWTATEEQIYAAAPRSTLPNSFDIEPPTGLVVSERLYVTRDGTQVKALARVAWVASVSPYADEYAVEARPVGAATWQNYGRTTDLFIELTDWTPGQWEFRIATVTRLGVYSPWATITREISGLGAPPAALQGLTIQAAGGLAVLKWTRSADVDVRIGGNIVIRFSSAGAPTWQNSRSMGQVEGNETGALVPLLPGTYLLRAEDSGGRQGPVVTVASKGAQVVPFAPVAMLQAEPTFVGTLNNVAADAGAGALFLPGATFVDNWGTIDSLPSIDFLGGVIPQGIFQFATGMDFGSVRRMRLRADVLVQGVAVTDLWDSRPGLISSWRSIDGTDGGQVDVVMQIRETDDDPAGSPVWSAWSRVDSSEIEARAIQARAILTTTDAAYTPRVTRLRLYADEAA